MKKLGLLAIPLMSISLLANCGCSAKTYHVKFTDNNELVEEKDYKANEVIIAPKDPAPYEKNHRIYTFEAWYDGDIKFESGVTKATKDVEYVAKFNGVDIKYTVTFMNGEEEYKKVTDTIFGDEIVVPETNPTKDPDKKYEYTFNKWIYKDTGKDFVTGDKVEGNTILVADYTKKAIKYDVTFKKGIETVDTKQFSVDNLSVKAPEFNPTSHYSGIWSVSGEHASSGKKAGSGATITFTEEDLDNWEFTYVESAISYTIKFEKDGEPSTEITKKITDASLNFKAPEFSSVVHHDCEWYCKEWPGGGKSLGSGVTCTDLTAQNLNNYTFVYKEAETNYTITFRKTGEEDVTRNVNLSNLSFTAPEFTSTKHHDGKWYCENLGTGTSLGSGATCTDLSSENLNNYTFMYQENPHEYDVTFQKSGEPDQVEHITINNREVEAPTFTAAKYRSGKWVSTNPECEIDSGATVTLSLQDWTFNYCEDDTNYVITFKKDNKTVDVKAVNLTNPSFITPKFENVPTHYNGWWICDDFEDGSVMKLGSETPCTLDKDNEELGNHTFVYSEEVIEYNVTFGSGDDYKGTEKISIEDLTIAVPSHDISEHYDSGVWKEGEIEIASGGEYIFTEEQLGEHTFTWTDTTPHQYQVRFNVDGWSPEIRNISISNLMLNAPYTFGASQPGYRRVWKSSEGLVVESGGSITFTESELKDYVFNEADAINTYTITYELHGGSVDGENPSSYDVSQDITLIAPTQDGFTFSGWYLAKNEHNKFQYQDGWEPGQVTGNLTLHADWHIANKTLENDYTWAQIDKVSKSGEASKYFDIGETKAVTVDNVDYQVRIIDFEKDKLADGTGNAGITFEFTTVIADSSGYWTDKSTVNYDFFNSNLNECLQPEGTIYNKINTVGDLMSNIKEVVKSVEIGAYSTLTNYDTKLFPLSYDEIVKRSNYPEPYEYYKTDTHNRLKKDENYWLRTPHWSEYKDAWFIPSYTGSPAIAPVKNDSCQWFVAPVFCI